MEDIENYTSLQEFTEDIAHSGNRPILTSQGKQGVHKGEKCLRGQAALVLLIALLTSVCVNIVLGVLLVNSRRSSVTVEPIKSDESEAASLSLKLTAMQERFSRLCSEYTTLGQTCSKSVIQCRPCPENWMHLEGRCYFFSDDKLDWQHSKESCASMGGYLTILHSHEQHKARFHVVQRLLTEVAVAPQLTQTTSVFINKMEVDQLLSLSGSALAQAISSLLETPGLYVFSDILELPNVRELETGPHAPVYQLLNLFAYGTYCDYKERAASLPELTPAQKNKLRHLSIISLASNLKCLPYSLLLQQLELKNVRELEDLLIEAVYSDIIHGKLDQRNQQVEVDCSIGRDLGPNELPNIANTLQEWCAGCEAVLCGIEEQVSRANQYRESQLKVKVQVETEVSNLQKTLKASSASPSSGPAPAGAASNQDADQPAEPRDPASSQEPRQPGKKSSKVKGTYSSHQCVMRNALYPAIKPD
ncbi:COP9 signalosome complex subunit 7b [Anabarilius grahami]|uniref:COP9 signalosome complex subunit 7b n=1 Tax=Anabarilius grahami TaxID=495550 RepID=A0A3N0YPP1_ANAGA|nr:COP9 signalosome complex subunit 7b [Anabarilius grahami]